MRMLLTKLASLRLTVVLMVLSMALVLGGTLAQRHMGTFAALDVYFATWLVFLKIPGTDLTLPMFPGGLLLGTLLIANMLAATWVMRRRVLRDPAFLLTHVGLIVLTAGVLGNTFWSVESYMQIDEGGSAAYSEDFQRVELAATRTVDARLEQVTAIPQEYFGGDRIRTEALPFELRVIGRYPRTVLARHSGDGHAGLVPQAAPKSLLDTGKRFLSLHVEVLSGDASLGDYWLTSGAVWDGMNWQEPRPVAVLVGDQTWQLALRPQRYYRGDTVALSDFQHIQYAGSAISAQFASHVTVHDAGTGETRAAVISMNRPLRFAGQTYYQSGFTNNDQTTVLQVVKNPGWLLPYVACSVIAVGMIWGFWRALQRHLARHRDAKAATGAEARQVSRSTRAALALAGLVAFGCLAALRLPPAGPGVDVVAFGRLPVLANGRIKPMDSVARNALLQLSGKQRVRQDGEIISASAWLLRLMTTPGNADDLRVFRIDSPDVLGLMGRLPEDGRYYSFRDLLPHMDGIATAAQEARATADEGHPVSAFGAAVMNLDERIMLYNRLRNTLRPGIELDYSGQLLRDHAAGGAWTPTIAASAGFIADAAAFFPVPPAAGAAAQDWRSVGDALLDTPDAKDLHPAALGYAELVDACKRGDTTAANAALQRIQGAVSGQPTIAKVPSEYRFNVAAPFYLAMLVYVGAFVLMLLAWLRWWEFGRRASLALLVVAVLVHTIGLIWRSWLHGYAPVTNLYSSAIFVGWMAALLSALLEWRQRHGVGNVAGAVVGFTTLIVAHHLARSGETMEMMRAVLASNFWLGTHVVTIAMGYSGMFVAGAIAAYAILHDAFRRRRPTAASRLAPSVYGVVCFAIVLSFVGTVLGGIWADQSWGRFWGWDPKENGALLIVAWCAVILHARVGRFLTDRAMHLCAVGGSIITAFSWFGVNLLGVGLHSYGFTSNGLLWLVAFVASQASIIVIGMWMADPDLEPAPQPQERGLSAPDAIASN